MINIHSHTCNSQITQYTYSSWHHSRNTTKMSRTKGWARTQFLQNSTAIQYEAKGLPVYVHNIWPRSQTIGSQRWPETNKKSGSKNNQSDIEEISNNPVSRQQQWLVSEKKSYSKERGVTAQYGRQGSRNKGTLRDRRFSETAVE